MRKIILMALAGFLWKKFRESEKPAGTTPDALSPKPTGTVPLSTRQY